MFDALDRLERDGYCFGARRVRVLAAPGRELLGDRMADSFGPIAERGALDHPYYSRGIRYQIWVTSPAGESIPLVDGGVFDWLANIASNRSAVFVATGAGAQLIALRFRASALP